MKSSERLFTPEQIKMVKKSAKKLHYQLTYSKDPLASDFLNSELGKIL